MALTVLPPGSTARVIVEELKRSGALIIEDLEGCKASRRSASTMKKQV